MEVIEVLCLAYGEICGLLIHAGLDDVDFNCSCYSSTAWLALHAQQAYTYSSLMFPLCYTNLVTVMMTNTAPQFALLYVLFQHGILFEEIGTVNMENVWDVHKCIDPWGSTSHHLDNVKKVFKTSTVMPLPLGRPECTVGTVYYYSWSHMAVVIISKTDLLFYHYWYISCSILSVLILLHGNNK